MIPSRLFWAAAGWLCLLLFPLWASADVVPPAPKDCPVGSTGTTSHAGAYCMPANCTGDNDCSTGEHCVAYNLCIEVVNTTCGKGGACTIYKVHGPCSATQACTKAGSCQGGTRCVPTSVPPAEPVPEAASSEPTPSDASMEPAAPDAPVEPAAPDASEPAAPEPASEPASPDAPAEPAAPDATAEPAASEPASEPAAEPSTGTDNGQEPAQSTDNASEPNVQDRTAGDSGSQAGNDSNPQGKGCQCNLSQKSLRDALLLAFLLLCSLLALHRRQLH